MRWLAVLPCVLAASCSVMMGHEPVAGWPQLEVVEHHVPHAQMRDRCAKYVAFGSSPEACAEFDLANRKCHIWFSSDFPPQPFVVEHERMHCAGYDHAGSTSMAAYLEYWNASQQSAAAGR
jgi:hypothetical protein